MYSQNPLLKKNAHYFQMQMNTHVFWTIKVVISLKEKKNVESKYSDPSKIILQSIAISGNQIFRN